MSAALAPSSCNQGCAHQLREHAHALGPCRSTTHETLETNRNKMVEPGKKGGSVLQSGCKGNGAVVLGNWQPIFRGAVATPKHALHAYNKYNIVHPPRMLLCDLYGACNDGMIHAGKLRKEKTVGRFSSGPGLAIGAIA
jgi:hypothetical protein